MPGIVIAIGMRLVIALALLAFSAPAGGDDRKNNHAERVKSFPKSLMPAMHKQLLGLITGKAPFDDKQLRKIAVIADWGAWYKRDGIARQSLTAVVGVFDPENKKCWTWNRVYFFRQRGDKRVFYQETDEDSVNEIDCTLLK